ncbi:MAG: hypothetical protein U9P79_04135 [Candidatus Cloacimonadota bacterium]|nr:hypothetical protein [Candidatus Cloacimonadota bacterium]
MSHTLRNTIVLAILAIIVIIVGLIINGSVGKELSKIQLINKEKVDQLEKIKNSNPNLGSQDDLIKELKSMKERVLNNNKLIPDKNNPIGTYKYLLKICDYYCPDLMFDFDIINSGSNDTTSYNTYEISGDAKVQSVYKFINQIETQPLLMTIESVNLTAPSKTYSDTIDYQIIFKAHYMAGGTKLTEIPFYSNNFASLGKNPFLPQIHPPSKTELEKQMVDIENVSMIGIAEDKIFVETSNGLIVTLSPGDGVAFGYLEKIDVVNNQAIFNINKIGINKTKILKLYKE